MKSVRVDIFWGIRKYHQMLLKLNPRPGNVLASGGIIKPDVKIARVGNEWKVLSMDGALEFVSVTSFSSNFAKPV